jgi:uncharacterized protein
MAVLSGPDRSPTTSIGQVLLAGAVGLLLALLLNAQAVVHAGAGMTEGPLRAATLLIGQTALQAARATHLTWPRDRLDALLGQKVQTAAPLLCVEASAAPSAMPIPSVTPPAAAAMAANAAAAPTVVIPSRLCDCPTAIPTVAEPTVTSVPSPTATNRAEASSIAASSQVVQAASPPIRPSPRPSPTKVTATPTAQPKPPANAPPRPVTAADPLRLLVTGDSLTGYLGPELVNEAAAVAPVQGSVDTHNGTGLTTPAYVDWSVLARQQVAKDHPDVVVVMLGGNDFENMTLPGGQFFQAGSSAWTQEYQRRAAICMQVWAQGGHARVYWLSMPPSRNPQWALDDAQINIALARAAAQVPGAEYLDILGPVTDHGQYADFVKDANGQTVLVREQDGVHLNIAGSTIVAQEVLPVIQREWGLRPAPAAGGTKG